MKTKIIIFIALVSMAFTYKPNRIITGKITSSSDGLPMAGVTVSIKGISKGTVSDSLGKYSIEVLTGNETLVYSFIGMLTQEVKVGKSSVIDIALLDDSQPLNEVVITGYAQVKRRELTGSVSVVKPHKVKTNLNVENQIQGRMAGVSITSSNEAQASSPVRKKTRVAGYSKYDEYIRDNEQTTNEEYNKLIENEFKTAKTTPLSTFSIDVDRAGYSNLRRMINDNLLPAKNSVRIEEMINYFDYEYPQPAKTSGNPVTINTELATSPWNSDLKLLKIGIQAIKIETESLPASNLVFLIDVSGSMSDENKLGLVKKGFELLINQLRETDKVAIVVYAGAAGVVLPSTSGKDKNKILAALNNLQSGGSTAGGEGIKLAYKLAEENFIEKGNNRVILASDGDFNVGVSSEKELENLITSKRKSNVFLSVLGFGMGNYKDNKMEVLADKGNGNYAYIDNLLEAQKVFVHEFGGTLFTVAKDVKLQLEFNPKFVKSYRLVGYENRLLQDEDFNDDKKDAGDMGAGHTVTALYEIETVGSENKSGRKIDKLKYQTVQENPITNNSEDLLTVKLRYKSPTENKSKLMETVVSSQTQSFEKASQNFRFAAAVAEFGMILRKSDFKVDANYEHVIKTAKTAKGSDDEGFRAEFIKLVKAAQLLDKEEMVGKN